MMCKRNGSIVQEHGRHAMVACSFKAFFREHVMCTSASLEIRGHMFQNEWAKRPF